jgi:hypothetical protein
MHGELRDVHFRIVSLAPQSTPSVMPLRQPDHSCVWMPAVEQLNRTRQKFNDTLINAIDRVYKDSRASSLEGKI